jgi:hypothetical protein
MLWLAGSPYAVWYSVQTSIPMIYRQQCSCNTIAVSLCFLSGRLGVIAGGLVAGRLMDMDYGKVYAGC